MEYEKNGNLCKESEGKIERKRKTQENEGNSAQYGNYKGKVHKYAKNVYDPHQIWRNYAK